MVASAARGDARGAARALAALAFFTLPAADAGAAETADSALVVTNPDWVRKPGGPDVDRLYPERAQREEVGGSATVSCDVTSRGRLDRCEIVSETPKNYGFGEAALAMAPLFEMKPKTIDGKPVDGGKVRIPLTFAIPGPPTRGEVLLQCLTTADRGVASCAVISETPAYAGYGLAALRQAATMTLGPEFGPATPGEIVRVPVVIDGPPPAAPLPAYEPPRRPHSRLEALLEGLFRVLGFIALLAFTVGASWLRLRGGDSYEEEQERDKKAMSRLLGRE